MNSIRPEDILRMIRRLEGLQRDGQTSLDGRDLAATVATLRVELRKACAS